MKVARTVWSGGKTRKGSTYHYPYTPEGITTGQGTQSVLQAGCGLCVVMQCGRGAGGGFSEGVIYVDKVFRY